MYFHYSWEGFFWQQVQKPASHHWPSLSVCCIALLSLVMTWPEDLKPLGIRRLYEREWDHTSPTKPLIRTSNVYDVRLAASLVPRLKCSPGSPSSGKLLVLGCKPVLEGSACVGCTVIRTFWSGICLITTDTSKKDCVKSENTLSEGLEKNSIVLVCSINLKKHCHCVFLYHQESVCRFFSSPLFPDKHREEKTLVN